MKIKGIVSRLRLISSHFISRIVQDEERRESRSHGRSQVKSQVKSHRRVICL